MAAEQDQITALQQTRTKIATARARHLETAAGFLDNRESLDIAIRRFENQVQALVIQKRDCTKSAKALNAAYLGLGMPKSIIDELVDKAKQIEGFDNRIKEIENTLADLMKNRDDADAQRCLADQDVADADRELHQIDQRIAEIRGF